MALLPEHLALTEYPTLQFLRPPTEQCAREEFLRALGLYSTGRPTRAYVSWENQRWIPPFLQTYEDLNRILASAGFNLVPIPSDGQDKHPLMMFMQRGGGREVPWKRP